MQDILQPPAYCPDAIATDVGWINPKNGELLISIRNLRQKIAEQEKVEQYKREHTPSETERVLERLTEITTQQKQEDDRSQTQRVLDELTERTIKEQAVDDRSDTQKALEALTEKTLQSIQVNKVDNNITLEIKESAEVAEEVKKPGRRGRPKKQQKNEQSE